MNVKGEPRKDTNVVALFTAAQVLLDIAMIVLAFYLAYRLRLMTTHVDVAAFADYLPVLFVQMIVLLGVFSSSKLYQGGRATSRLDETAKIMGAVILGLLITLALNYLLFVDLLALPRLMVVYICVLTVLFISFGRFLHDRLIATARARGIGIDRVLIIGTTEIGRMIHQKINHSPDLGYQVAGYIAESENSPKRIMGLPVLGQIQEIPEIIDQENISEVIIAQPEATRWEILDIISLCERGKVSVKVFPDVFQIMASEISIGVLGGLPLLTIRDPALRGWKFGVKRGMDIALSAAGLIALSPVMLLTAILIKLDSPGPVFYYQERAGLDARIFQMIKFRSMRQDAERSGPGWTTENDPRRTRFGSILRKFSLDEFPQLINVFLGDMSLVGPRPERPVYVEQFRKSIPRYMDRHREKAGITGWAQVNGLRGDTSIAERTKYDLWYVENWSLLLDLKILIRTALKVFSDRHAY